MATFTLELLGWIGAALIILPYFLLTEQKLKSNSVEYQAMNLIGSVLVGFNAYFNRAYPSLVINAIWVIIALFGIEKLFEKSLRTRLRKK